jgi:hypothetical protein
MWFVKDKSIMGMKLKKWKSTHIYSRNQVELQITAFAPRWSQCTHTSREQQKMGATGPSSRNLLVLIIIGKEGRDGSRRRQRLLSYLVANVARLFSFPEIVARRGRDTGDLAETNSGAKGQDPWKPIRIIEVTWKAAWLGKSCNGVLLFRDKIFGKPKQPSQLRLPTKVN